MENSHQTYMQHALRLADSASALDEVPVGSVIVRGDLLLGEGFNQNIDRFDPTAHAEINALREACQYQQNYRLKEATLYVTLEPCLMCFMAMIHARVTTLVYGASDPKSGFTCFLKEREMDLLNHRIQIVPNVLAEESGNVIRAFFKQKRDRGKRKWMKQK